VSPADLRAATGTQPFVAEAAVNLVYVADYAKIGDTPDSDRILYSGAETGFIGQNVYLFCASEGLATVVRASIDRQALAKALNLRPEQRITLAQSVGYPK
jgi:nitroreductase